jgi:hypothetical protein
VLCKHLKVEAFAGSFARAAIIYQSRMSEPQSEDCGKIQPLPAGRGSDLDRRRSGFLFFTE